MTRIEKLWNRIKDNSDGMIITSETNQLYFTDFKYSDGYLIVTNGKGYLITDFRYAEAAKKYESPTLSVVIFGGLADGKIKSIFEENNVNSLLVEDSIPLSQYDALKRQFPDINFNSDKDAVCAMREYKSQIEVDCIIKAQRIAEKSLDELLKNFDRNMTEKHLAAYLEYLMKKNGADGISFNTIAVSGKASSLPHGVPRDNKLENGFLTIDFGATYKGYHSDMTRTYCIGSADSEMKKVYSTVLEAQNRAIDAIMQGERNCVKIDNISRSHIYSQGYEGCFGHGLGHGVGLVIHESPRLSPKAPSDKMLDVGHVVTVEPGIYIENKYGVRIEDMIYMSENGPQNITKMPKNLIEL